MLFYSLNTFIARVEKYLQKNYYVATGRFLKGIHLCVTNLPAETL
jgi:hypothetical protein